MTSRPEFVNSPPPGFNFRLAFHAPSPSPPCMLSFLQPTIASHPNVGAERSEGGEGKWKWKWQHLLPRPAGAPRLVEGLRSSAHLPVRGRIEPQADTAEDSRSRSTGAAARGGRGSVRGGALGCGWRSNSSPLGGSPCFSLASALVALGEPTSLRLNVGGITFRLLVGGRVGGARCLFLPHRSRKWESCCLW